MTKTNFFSMLPAIIQIALNGILLIVLLVSYVFVLVFFEIFVPVVIAVLGNIAAALIISDREIDLTPYAGWFTAEFVFPTAIVICTLYPIYLISPNDYTASFILAAVQGIVFLVSSAILYKQVFMQVPADKQRLKSALWEFFAATLCNPNLYLIIFMLCGILRSVAAYHFD